LPSTADLPAAQQRNQAVTHLNQAALAFARGDRDRAAELLRRTQSTLDGAGIVLDRPASCRPRFSEPFRRARCRELMIRMTLWSYTILTDRTTAAC
jgi:hypothetical protein